MKKTISICLTFLISFLIGCSGSSGFPSDVSCEDIADAVLNVTEHPEAEEYYTLSKGNLDSYSMSLWSDGLFEESSEFSKLDDYAIFLSAGTTTYEVAVLKAKNSDDVSLFTQLIERRKETLALGDKGMYDPNFKKRMDSSKVITEGNIVIFIVNDDITAAEDAINALK